MGTKSFLLAFLLWVPTLSWAGSNDPYTEQRERMVREQIEVRGIKDPKVLEVMRKVPRHLFVPPAQQRYAYDDRPLPIG